MSSTSSIKPLRLYGGGGPNPMKVMIILKELGLAYDVEKIQFADVKKPEYVAINPNGRLPSLYDPNTDLTIWESGAIIEYLVEKYDVEHRISFDPTSKDYWHAKQWLHFQATGQGPYFGQLVWFSRYHSEKIPSAIERYRNEVLRVTKVLDGELASRDWLVGNKMSYVDLAFFPWQDIIQRVTTIETGEYSNVEKWLGRMKELKSVQGMLSDTASS